MKSPLQFGPLQVVPEVESTQDFAMACLAGTEPGPIPGVIRAIHQSRGRGRHERQWFSRPGESLTASMIFGQYADHPMPWLVGMSVALAAAAAAHCLVRWPNDLILDGRKLGGILTEVFTRSDERRIPVVGIGINVNVREFPEELSSEATSLVLHRADHYDVEELLQEILERLEELPEPTSWQALEPVWMQFDCTPGKRFALPSGDEAVAIGVGPSGALIASVGGETRVVLSVESAMASAAGGSPTIGDAAVD